MFPRNKYYSQTDVLKKYKINAKDYQDILQQKKIDIVSKDINLGEFNVKTIYVLKKDVEVLNLQLR